eukprot:1077477-Amphidinium_carterae.1
MAVVSAERSISFVQGGGPLANAAFESDGGSTDELMKCARGVLALHGKALFVSEAECSVHFRTVARYWLRSAYKQHWLCAGRYLEDHAALASCSWQHFIEHICDPVLRLAPPPVVIDALSAFYAVNMYVIDEDGARLDGFVRCAGYGMQRTSAGWRVLDHWNRPLAASFALSPTEPFIGSSASMPAFDPQQFVQGAGKLCHVHQNAVAQSVCECLTRDLATVQCTYINDDLLNHIVLSDKRCSLACFQARTIAQ